MKKRNKKTNELIIKKNNFINLLKKVNLNGLIEDCVLKTNKKYGYIEAVDLSQSIIVSSKEKIFKTSINKNQFGLTNIDVLLKFIKTIPDNQINLQTTDDKFIINRKDNKRKLEFLLSDPDVIPTILDEEDNTDKIKKIQCYAVAIYKSIVKDFLTYINISKSKTVTIKTDTDNEKFIIVIGSQNENRFVIDIESSFYTFNDVGNFEVSFNGEYLSKILGIIDFDDKDENSPLLYLSEEAPLIVEYNNTIWSLAPISSEEIEE